jgi:hypothetical protein
MEAAEEPFEADGRKFNRGTFVIANADRGQIEAAARDLGISRIRHGRQVERSAARAGSAAGGVAARLDVNTQQDGWFRITLDQLKIPYTYVADTKVRETPNLRDQFDVIIVPPFVRRSGVGRCRGFRCRAAMRCPGRARPRRPVSALRAWIRATTFAAVWDIPAWRAWNALCGKAACW